MSDKIFLPLPPGNTNFTEIRTVNCYYVDKTPYLKTVFSQMASTDKKTSAAGTPVMLFTRPRRFGKTLLMDMFESFLKVNAKNPDDTSLQQELFKGLKILDDKDFCEKYMGRFPVIFITLKDVHGDDYEKAYTKLAELVANKANEFSFLKDSHALNDDDRDTYAKLTSSNYLKNTDAKAQSYVTSAIKSLSSMLYKHFKRQVYILIDEYDVPLAKAHEAHKKDFHQKMVSLISSFLGFLKDPQKDPETGLPKIGKVVITGCLKVAKNSIFTGVNNLYVNTVADTESNYSDMIGFTKEETRQLLKDYEFEDYEQTVKEHYDGYRFFKSEMFCPWDVINFVQKNLNNKLQGDFEHVNTGNYWDNSSSDSALGEYIGYLTDTDTQKMQDLVDGKSINFRLNESMNYDCLSQHDPNDFWSLLLHTGYLTLDFDKTKSSELSKDSNSNKDIFARIPNLEIKDCFTDNIKKRFKNQTAPSSVANKIANSLMDGDNVFVQTQLRQILRSFISIRDSATKAPHENYYHGYLNGLFTNCTLGFFGEYHSNSETGDGYADISFSDAFSEKAVIIEIKSTKNVSELADLSEAAVQQIEDKHYTDHYLENKMVQSIYAYGIAFSGKNCYISCKKIK